MIRLSAAMLLGLLVVPPLARATPVQASATVQLTFRDCVAGATACDRVSPILIGSLDGDPGALEAVAAQADPAFGTSSGDAQLAGSAGAPLLDASASSVTGKRAGSSGAALQRYVYTGAAPTTRTFRATLTYDQTVPAANAGLLVNSGANAALELFRLAGAALEAGTTPQENFDAVVSGYETAPGFVSLGLVTRNSPGNVTAAGVEELAVTVALDPGDSVWVVVLQQAIAASGAAVSARLVSGWDVASDLQPAHQAADALLERLAGSVAGVGPGQLLSFTVAQAQLQAAVPATRAAACGTLRFFDFEVRVLLLVSQRARRSVPWAITAAQAADLLDRSRAVQAALGCRAP